MRPPGIASLEARALWLASLRREPDPEAAAEVAALPRRFVSVDQVAPGVFGFVASIRCPWRGPKLSTGCDCSRLCLLLRGDPPGAVRPEDCQSCEVARGAYQLAAGRALPGPCVD